MGICTNNDWGNIFVYRRRYVYYAHLYTVDCILLTVYSISLKLCRIVDYPAYYIWCRDVAYSKEVVRGEMQRSGQ